MFTSDYNYVAIVPGTVDQVAKSLADHYGGEVLPQKHGAVVKATRGSAFVSVDTFLSLVPLLWLLAAFFQHLCRNDVWISVVTHDRDHVSLEWRIKVIGGAAYIGAKPPLIRECETLHKQLSAETTMK